ncbi:hypothetical protein [Paenibacillus glycinis]|uniref:Uncharacterized protein n=1 Tax=Paenibacillus glycinis TaxID=2697035 RepID=A0ABW9XSH1_9BACL|nr:hypothetical protein [Paenibacillus glycinis]NBD25301.1 hypothetical protein [Paenibacillus glycinis]
MEHNFTIEPGAFDAFADEAALIEQCKVWGLLSDKAVKSKAFVYKRGSGSMPCAIIGLVDFMTAVIEFENKQRHLIHPSLLKEMQASTYGQRTSSATDQRSAEPDESGPISEGTAASADGDASSEAGAPAAAVAAAPAETAPADKPRAAAQPASPADKPAKKKSSKPQLPEEKVKLTAVVKEFTTVPNHFAEEDDEVIIYGNVAMAEPELELGDAWSSYSNTLKKFELEVGDTLTFEAKIVAKKLTKHPVPYKINNPSKIAKV